MAYDRATLRRLAQHRLAEARLLLQHGQPSGAYYLAGYAVECALKARIASDFRADEIPDRALVNSIYTHNLTNLLRLSGLEEELNRAVNGEFQTQARWTVISKWSEAARYEIWTQEAALAMLEAVDGEEGMFRWLTDRW